MNRATLIGNLTKDPDMRQTQSGVSVCTFTLAVQRRYADQNGEKQTDFFNIVVWRQQAENCARYLQKGSQCAVEGNIQNRTYEKDGEKRYITEIVADRVEFLGRPAQSNGGSGYDEFGRKEAIEDLPSVEDDTELPF